ncbi:MAG TPA: chemotaxis protein CheX [Polyangia bacterium]
MALPLQPAALSSLVSKVMEASCGLNFKPTGVSYKPVPPWRAVALQIHGGGTRTVAIGGDQDACMAIASGLLQRPEKELDTQMVEESMLELLNMVAGHIKRAMAIDVALGLPEIVSVEDIEQRMARGGQRAAVINERKMLTIWLTNQS